ncbi:carbon-nitrogen hydrolase family protein [Streptomyces sp. NPDC050560]|uniref:carbon-nitrogen hydrolase family protein n=1 Tax=Streptomyces sp. NPDC050560 TaxID=3365630 RepID=UPI00378A9088
MTVIATVALEGTYDVDISTKRHLALMDEAAAAGAELVVFPEVSLQGYPPDMTSFYPERIKAAYDNAESVTEGPHSLQIQEHARSLGLHTVFGMNETGDAPGVIYNTMVLTGPDGYLGKYRKVHVGITEQLTWRRGDDWPVYETPFGRVGMLICYDKMWPESTRELMLRGADLLVMSTAWPMVNGEQDPETNVWAEFYRLYDRARAAENSRWFVSSNFAGELGGARFLGLSQIVSPIGRVVATTGPLTPGIAVADVDIAGGIAEANALLMGARLVRDRRPDTYHALSGRMPHAVDG